MWTEPLTAHAAETDPSTFEVVVRDGDGATVAHVPCAFSAEAGFGAFGEMRIVRRDGALRQRLRALVLLVREALRFGADAGITRFSAETPERLAAFATRIGGITPGEAGDRRIFAGELHAARTHALTETNDRGELLNASPRELADLERDTQQVLGS